jgi:hypothetical protein
MVQQNNQQQKHFRTLKSSPKKMTLALIRTNLGEPNHQYATTANSSKKIEKPEPQK